MRFGEELRLRYDCRIHQQCWHEIEKKKKWVYKKNVKGKEFENGEIETARENKKIIKAQRCGYGQTDNKYKRI